MKWVWWIAAIVVWLASAACIIGTLCELAAGKDKIKRPDFWGGVAFHGVTAIAALWLLMKALSS